MYHKIEFLKLMDHVFLQNKMYILQNCLLVFILSKKILCKTCKSEQKLKIYIFSFGRILKSNIYSTGPAILITTELIKGLPLTIL